MANPTASHTSTTTYTVTATDGNGCTNTDDIVVTVLSLPNVSAGADQSVTLGDAISLDATVTGNLTPQDLYTEAQSETADYSSGAFDG